MSLEPSIQRHFDLGNAPSQLSNLWCCYCCCCCYFCGFWERLATESSVHQSNGTNWDFIIWFHAGKRLLQSHLLCLYTLPADFGILLRFFMLNDSTKWTRAIWDRHGVSFFGFHTFVACHVSPLTAYHLPLTSYHLPFATLHRPRRERGYILSLCHFALVDTFFNLRARWETFATMGYQMTTCHEADTTCSRRNGQRTPGWLPDCLTSWLPAWLYSISIGACFKSIFIIIFISFFPVGFLVFLFFYSCSLGSFAFTVRSFSIIIAPYGQFVGCFCGPM